MFFFNITFIKAILLYHLLNLVRYKKLPKPVRYHLKLDTKLYKPKTGLWIQTKFEPKGVG